MVRQVMLARALLFQEFLGAKIRPSAVRDGITRLALFECAEGREQRLSFYQSELQYLGSRFAIRDEVHRLVQLGALVLTDDPTDSRAILVKPSQKLVDWYEQQVPRLVDEWYRLCEVWRERNR